MCIRTQSEIVFSKSLTPTRQADSYLYSLDIATVVVNVRSTCQIVVRCFVSVLICNSKSSDYFIRILNKILVIPLNVSAVQYFCIARSAPFSTDPSFLTELVNKVNLRPTLVCFRIMLATDPRLG